MQKQNIILLHGALGSQAQLSPLKAKLENTFNVFSFDFDGHGNNQNQASFDMQHFSRNILDFMEKNQLEKTAFFGYSMGGYVALTFALANPGKVEKIVTLGTKFDWTPETAALEIKKLDPEKIAEKVPPFASMLLETHGENWKNMVRNTAAMMSGLGNGKAMKNTELASIQTETLLFLAEHDSMVTREETEEVQSILPAASFQLIPGAKHPIETVDAADLAERIVQFLQ